jgi:hypothetical protein
MKRLVLALAAVLPLPALATPPPTLDIHFVLHQDVQMNEQDFVSEHVSAWLGHMRSEVVPGQDIRIHVHRQWENLELTPYGYERALHDWARRAGPVADRLAVDRRAIRMVLVTQGAPTGGNVLGIAFAGALPWPVCGMPTRWPTSWATRWAPYMVTWSVGPSATP